MSRINLLLVGDPHAHPDYDNDRFAALGEYIVETRPTHIVLMGDLGDYPSLCKYEKGTAKHEGKRLAKDEAAVQDALEKLFEPLTRLHIRQAAARRKRYRPELHCLGGNHDEERLFRLGDENPELEGAENSFIELVREYGFRYTPYRQTLVLGGMALSHHFPSGPMGRPMSSPARILKKNMCSSAVGHDHSYQEYHETSPATGKKYHVFMTGCYAHPSYTARWCRDTVALWDFGVVRLDGLQDGDYQKKAWVSQELLLKTYGG